MASAVQHEHASMPALPGGTLLRVAASWGAGLLAWASLAGHVLLGLALAATGAQMAGSAR